MPPPSPQAPQLEHQQGEEVSQQVEQPADNIVNVLPRDLLGEVLSYLNIVELATVSAVCRKFRFVAAQDRLWKAHFEAFFPKHLHFRLLPEFQQNLHDNSTDNMKVKFFRTLQIFWNIYPENSANLRKKLLHFIRTQNLKRVRKILAKGLDINYSQQVAKCCLELKNPSIFHLLLTSGLRLVSHHHPHTHTHTSSTNTSSSSPFFTGSRTSGHC
jgi:hypothetical protein